MRELSLHILDLMENATRAGATVVYVGITENVAQDTLEIVVEDNGPGLPASSDAALDPFYTTKGGKRTGLGLS
ncbi:MAG TPA: ATP-binding protein, partial [Candidatus Hydrogenedentes bacterium]|nr:ATP-binding protein [Candidatus Hydrogenedentota bacterium]